MSDSRRSGFHLRAALVVALAAVWCAQTGWAANRPTSRLGSFYDDWLDSVEAIAEPEEALAFRRLVNDTERERFMTAFWEARGEEALRRFRGNQLLVREIQSRSRERERVALLWGLPDRMETFPSCRSALRRLEIWTYSSWNVKRQTGREGGRFFVVFVQESNFDPRTARLFSRNERTDRLLFGAETARRGVNLVESARRLGCLSGAEASRLSSGLSEALEWSELIEDSGWPRPDLSWLRSFDGDVRRRAIVWPSSLGVSYPGGYFDKTVLEGELLVEHDRLATQGSLLLDRVEIVGDVYRGGRLVDAFTVTHHVAGSPPAGGLVSLKFYRKLSPGEHELRLRVVDSRGLALLRENRVVSVPRRETPAPEPTGFRGGFVRLTRDEVVHLRALVSVELRAPGSQRGSGPVAVEAVTTGGPIGSVVFLRDGEEIAVDETAPYQVRVELPALRHRVEAVVLDSAGDEMARDARWLRRDPSPLRVTLEMRGDEHVDVAVTVPEDETLSSLTCTLRGRTLRTSTSSSMRCPVPAPPHAPLTFVRALAELESGEEAEAVLFLSDDAPESLDVSLVELFVSVFDAGGRPVIDLDSADLRVLMEGEQASLERFGKVSVLPLNVALLMDTSSSMGRGLRTAASSAQEFFANVLEEQDLASLLTFNHDLRRRVGFSSEPRVLADALRSLRARGSTRLYDGIYLALHTFSGLESRRALVVLSDGADTESDFAIDSVLEAARRSGVLVFPIALGRFSDDTLDDLGQLARISGGQLFRASGPGDLESIYRRIEEILRTQYHVVVRTPPGAPLDGAIDVELLRPGLQARSVRGYYR